jgi:hypothetical protein
MAKNKNESTNQTGVKKPNTPTVFYISGHVTHRDTGQGLAGLRVEAINKDLDYEQPLSRALTDREGKYALTFTADQIGKAEKGGPDIVVKVFDNEGAELGASNVIYNAPAKVKIDIAVTLGREPTLSEYEKLLAALRPLLQVKQIVDLEAEGISTLAKESGIEQERIEGLVQNAKLSRETDLPTEVLYGLARLDLTPTLEVFFTHDAEKLRRAIETAGRAHIIPAISGTALNRIMGDVETMSFRPMFSKASLADLLPSVRLPPDSRLAVRLNELDITTPAILIATGAERILQRAEFTEAEGAAIRDLESHARLSLLNVSPVARKVLFNSGFLTPTQIASEPETSFRQKVESILGPGETARIHGIASVQKAFLDNLSTAERRVPRNNIGSVSVAASVAEESDNDLADCGCKDCEAATSPAAYLTDLLSYTKAKLSWQYDAYFPAGAVTPEFLSLLLKQPIVDLSTDCESVEEEISYVRLCIESLLELFRENLAANPDVACSPLQRRVSFAFAADVDGDGQDELILGFDADFSSMLRARHPVGTGVWVMRYDRTAGRWHHLAPGTDPTAATFYLPPGHKVKFAFAGKFQPDTSGGRKDRRQLVLAIKDQNAAGLPIWVLEFDQKRREWKHVSPGPLASTVEPGGIFEPDVLDFAISPVDVEVVGGFSADVDGDGLDEFVAYGTTPTQQNAFWVFKPRALSWETVGPAGTSHDEAFACYVPSAGIATYPVKLATFGDVDRDGRAEIIAFPDAPGAAGKNPWIMKWDASNSTWNHLLPSGSLAQDADAELGPRPWPAAWAFVAQITGAGSAELVVAPDAMTVGSDPNRFGVFRYKAPTPPNIDNFDELAAADCSPTRDSVTFALAADVDGDSRDELVVLTRTANVHAAWIMDRTNAGTWQHLSPLAGHPLGADLEWTPGGAYSAQFAFAADVDGDGQGEVVVVGNTCTEIWVLKYRASQSQWEHVRASDSRKVRYEGAAYLALLTQLGISYDEVRLARSADDAARRALADRLAISLGVRTGAAGDRLDQLVCDPASVSEGRLEELFGLVNTHRDPLTSVAVSGDSQKQTRHWRLEGLD